MWIQGSLSLTGSASSQVLRSYPPDPVSSPTAERATQGHSKGGGGLAGCIFFKYECYVNIYIIFS